MIEKRYTMQSKEKYGLRKNNNKNLLSKNVLRRLNQSGKSQTQDNILDEEFELIN